MVFHHGELRESGTHNELLAERGLYWRLYQLQYSDEKIHTSQPGVVSSDTAPEFAFSGQVGNWSV
jgi:hypothetical protein